jgi:hypothetical protein
MFRVASLALAAVCLVPLEGSALELKNVRPSYGPLGAARKDTKCVPGDSLFITYDIEGLKIDQKTLRANYTTLLELIDSTGQVAFKKETPNDVPPQLGGQRMPGDLFVILPRTQKPGKHKVRLTVKDTLAKESKSFEYGFEVVPPEFSFVGVTAKAVGFPGENYVATFAIVDMMLDAKKQPDVHIAMRVYEETGKNWVAMPLLSNLPKDLPEEIDLKKENFVPMQFPIYLNRTGTFIIEVVAHDKHSKKTIQLRYPLTVLDVTSVGAAAK